MKTKFVFLMIALMIGGHAQAKVGGQEGSGGGGLMVEKGSYVTLGTAGFFVNPEAKRALPSLDLIDAAVKNIKIPDDVKKSILSAVYPVGGREYFDIQDGGISEAEYAKLVQEYVDLSKYPADKIALFAVTNPKTRVTYILPAFYKLQPIEQAAILFHEAYWILKPRASYAEVVRAEIAFQKWIEQADPNGFSFEMAKVLDALLFDRAEVVLNWALASDLAKGHLKGLTSGSGVSATKLFKAGNIKLMNDPSNDWKMCEVSTSLSAVDAFALSRNFPKSAWLALVAKKLDVQPNGSAGYRFKVQYPVTTKYQMAGRNAGQSYLVCEELNEDNFDWNFKHISKSSYYRNLYIEISRLPEPQSWYEYLKF